MMNQSPILKVVFRLNDCIPWIQIQIYREILEKKLVFDHDREKREKRDEPEQRDLQFLFEGDAE